MGAMAKLGLGRVLGMLIAQMAVVGSSRSPAATFLQGRVNIPNSMRGQGYYTTGSFQGKQNFGVVKKCDRTGEFCRVVKSMTLTARGASDAFLCTMTRATSHNGPSRWEA